MFFLTHEKNISKLTYINSVFPEAMSLASTLILELKGMIALDVMLNFTIYMYIIFFSDVGWETKMTQNNVSST